MRKPPFLATLILVRLGAAEEALVGDVLEEYRRGRSRAWYWSQALASVALRSSKDLAKEPLAALAAISTGWAVLLMLFFTLGTDATLAMYTKGSGRGITGGGGLAFWWPLYASAAAVSCLGFALAAIAIVRVNGGRWASMLGPFMLSAVLVQASIHAARLFRLPVWRSDTLFYVAPMGFPYQFYWGILLTLIVTFVAGLLGARARSTMARARVRPDSHAGRRPGGRAGLRLRDAPPRALADRRLPAGGRARRALHARVRRRRGDGRPARRGRRHPADVRRRPAVPPRGAARGAARRRPRRGRAEPGRHRSRRRSRPLARLGLAGRHRLRPRDLGGEHGRARARALRRTRRCTRRPATSPSAGSWSRTSSRSSCWC